MRLRRNPSFCLFFLGLIASAAFANRGVTPEDYFAFHFLSDAHISPDGKQVTYVDDQRRPRAQPAHLGNLDGGGGRAVGAAAADVGERQLELAALESGWIAAGVLSSREAESLECDARDPARPPEPPRPQICILPLEGGEAQVLTHLKNGVSAFQWSPDGKRFVAVSRTGPSDAIAPKDRKSDVRHYKHIRYKFNDTGWFDDKRSHLWIIDAASGARSSSPPARIGTTRTRNGRPTARASPSFPIAPGTSTTTAATTTSG